MKFLFYLIVTILLIGFAMSVVSFFVLSNFAISSLITVLTGTALFVTLLTSEDFDISI